MKALHALSLTLAAAVLLAFSPQVQAANAKKDSRIEMAAQKSHVFKTYLQGDNIRISSKGGAVTITGTVSENFHKILAQETVAGLPGVESVDNRLEVNGAVPTANSDAWLRDKVKVTLLFHRSVSARSTEVDVKDGNVTLKGVAASQAQKELTTEFAKDVEGVKDVNNEMTLAKDAKKERTVGEKIDDASITAQVKLSLINHRSTSVLTTSVKTKRGVVTIGGKARNASEKELVSKLVSDVHGVNKVKNQMKVE